MLLPSRLVPTIGPCCVSQVHDDGPMTTAIRRATRDDASDVWRIYAESCQAASMT
jgi:hypothetical protein